MTRKMLQDMTNDTILHITIHRLVRNLRTPVRLGAYLSSFKGVLRTMLILLMIFGVGTAWGQTHPYAGVWYLTNDYKKNTTYYVVPAANPQITTANHVNEDAYFSSNYSQAPGDPEKPFLTTFMTNGDLNSIWVFVPVTGENNYYYIVHANTGKYLKYQTYLTGNDARRKFVHLETIATTNLGDTEKFQITALTVGSKTGVKIKPKNNDMYFNIAGENQDRYNGGDTSPYYSGIIGGMSGADGGSLFMLREAKYPAPKIDYDSEDNTFTISYDKIPVGFDILYSIDGNEPSIGGSNTTKITTTTERNSGPIQVNGAYTVKAVVARYGFILTGIASQPVGRPDNPTITPPTDCNNEVEISAGESVIYYTLNGTDPDKSSTLYTGPFVLNEDVTIKAVAYNGDLRSQDITTLAYTPPYSAKPTISRNGITITITGTGTIYYTVDGGEPGTGSSVYNGPITLSDGSGEMTIKAVAKDGTKGLSCVAEITVSLGYFIDNVTKLNGITNHLNERCIVTNNFDASGLTTSISGFTGEFDGGYYTISGLTKPLFTNLDGGTVKNVKLSLGSDGISGTNVGAICDVASGSTKIYNCGVLSGSISGSGYVGGLVGHISDGSVRVVNCYNYADVSSTGAYAAGIVGYNGGTVANDKKVGNVRIALCMMYGSVSGATHISPVYGGNHVSNVQNFTEYNYYLYSNERDENGNRIEKIPYTTGDYNDQLAIDKDDYLTRYPFYLHCMNTHRRLAAFFLFGESNSNNAGAISNANISEIGHWVLDKSKADYPIIEEWETDTRKVLDAPAGTTVSDDNLGTSLAVTVKIGSNTYHASLPITDMDEENYDYTWGKVVLPFANEFEKNTDYTRICTGWKITDISSGNGASFSNYNVSDRDCTTKDLYSITGFIFAQGGNFVVPYKVTSIEITANFAKAYYLSDATYDVGYDANYGNAAGLGGNVPSGDNAFYGQTVYTSLASALGAMSASATPHSQAVVLVGNYHYSLGKTALNSYLEKGLTIMSIDEDNNQEPDYGWYSNNSADRPNMPPVRFDFLPMIPLGMAAHVTGSKGYPGIPIWKSRGWFEMTETCLCIMNQFELDSGYFNTSDSDTKNYRCIINGGYFSQMVRSNDAACSKVSYFQIGGNAYIKEFYPGNHSKRTWTNPLVPINVTGGEIEECFMTGYKSEGKVSGSNIYFWCAGGKIHKFLGAYMDAPTAATVNLTAKIDHALIGRFFGGGTSPNASITGAIDVTINNSKVDFYCGGPEFSSLTAKPTVKTSATKTEFGEYYGAGFGGTSVTYFNDIDNGSYSIADAAITTYPTYFNTYYLNTTNGRLKNKSDYGIGTCYKFEYLYHSASQFLVARHFTGYAQFSLATTGNVINELNNCKIKKFAASETVLGKEATKGDFYGAGCQGMVDGTVTSTLTSCEVEGSAYGGGYQATSNEVEVYPTTAPTRSVFTKETGLFSEFGTVAPNTFTWEQGNESNQNTAVDCGSDGKGGKLYTSKDIPMSDLGNVTGDITLTLSGTTKVGYDTNGSRVVGVDGKPTGGDVFGGGNESKSLGNTTVTLQDDVQIGGNVFGGGNEADVSGSTTVNIQE